MEAELFSNAVSEEDTVEVDVENVSSLINPGFQLNFLVILVSYSMWNFCFLCYFLIKYVVIMS